MVIEGESLVLYEIVELLNGVRFMAREISLISTWLHMTMNLT